MNASLEKIARSTWHLVPASIRRRLGDQSGRRLMRFAPAAALALCASQLTYFVCFNLIMLSGLKSGAAGWLAGAAVSYVVSRWAWERTGRPDLLKETLPFWAISLCVGAVLTGAGKLAGYGANQLGLHGLEKVVFAQGLYLAANCITFLTRFVIFHKYVFADQGRKLAVAAEARPVGTVWPAPPSRPPAPTGWLARPGRRVPGADASGQQPGHSE
jgi:putative flippase GtrA